MLDKAFKALESYSWGVDRNVLNPIDEAITASHGNAAARKKLETRLAAVLASGAPRNAKDFVCRKLKSIGTSASVGALAKLLPMAKHSHMARYALERIPAAEAAAALRGALPKVKGELKVGIIGSLGVRQDAASVDSIAKLLSDSDSQVARAAAIALGAIRSPQAAKALASSKTSASTKLIATDASFACAEGLLADGKKSDALAIYKGLISGDLPKHVRLAATRGMLACAGNSK